MPQNWSLQEIDDAHSRQVYFTTVITLEWQLWYKWKWQLNRLHVSLYSTYVDFYWPGNLYLHQQYTTQQESETNHRAKKWLLVAKTSVQSTETPSGEGTYSVLLRTKTICGLCAAKYLIGVALADGQWQGSSHYHIAEATKYKEICRCFEAK